MPSFRRRLAALLHARPIVSSMLALALASALGPRPAAGYDYSAYRADYAGEELMRLTNLDRAAFGLAALHSDPFLISLARDGTFRCPSTGAAVDGRARNMAERDVFSHSIAGCTKSNGTPYTILDVLYPADGYNTYRAENIAINNYGLVSTTYASGCDSTGAHCVGSKTTTPQSVGVAEAGFMKSAGHRANVLGHYDRFGCGSWLAANGMKYYVCLFSLGGPKALDLKAPAFTSVSGSGLRVAAGATATFSASFADNFRLAEGYVKLDTHLLTGWAYSYNQQSASRSVRVSTTGLAKGTHSITWAVRDVSTLASYRAVYFTVV